MRGRQTIRPIASATGAAKNLKLNMNRVLHSQKRLNRSELRQKNQQGLSVWREVPGNERRGETCERGESRVAIAAQHSSPAAARRAARPERRQRPEAVRSLDNRCKNHERRDSVDGKQRVFPARAYRHAPSRRVARC